MYWTTNREDAEAYMDNPPFGGPCLYEAEFDGGLVLDLTDNVMDIDLLETFAKSHIMESCRRRGIYIEGCMDYYEQEIRDFIDNPLLIETITGRRMPYTIWEDNEDVMDYLMKEDYAAVMFEDDFPPGCITFMFVNSKPINPRIIYCKGDEND